LKLAVLVSGVLALAKLGFLNFIPGRFGERPKYSQYKISLILRLFGTVRVEYSDKNLFV
jgi:hypothetical protein